MNEVIYETVVSTVDTRGVPHIAPMGVRYQDDGDGVGKGGSVILMPFKPSTTHDNIVASGHAVLNIVTDTRVFAGCVTGRRDWPLRAAEVVPGMWLQAALTHVELRLADSDGDPQRPRLRMARVHEVQHAPFVGLNRAQAAVLEGAVLVSRLHMLAPAKVAAEMAYLQIAIDKTAAPAEHEAWAWLRAAIAAHPAHAGQAPHDEAGTP